MSEPTSEHGLGTPGASANSGEHVDQEQIDAQASLPDWGEVQRGGHSKIDDDDDPGTQDGQVQDGPEAKQPRHEP